MQEPSILRINEIFWSFQGEGLRVGFPSIFIRLAGCQEACPYCDSKFALDKGTEIASTEIRERLIQWRLKWPASQVVITGGEPMEQDLSHLVRLLKEENFPLAIETNGCHFQDLAIDWWTVSPKDGRNYFIHDYLYQRICEVKLIVNENLNTNVIKMIRKIGNNFPIFLQPQFYDPDKYEKTHQLYLRCQELGLPEIRIGYQLHRIYGKK